MKTIKLALGDVTLVIEQRAEDSFCIAASDCEGAEFVSRYVDTLAEAFKEVALFAAYEYQHATGDVEITVIA